MKQYQPEAILNESFIQHVEYHPTLESTNLLAVELRDELSARSPAVVLTDEQTAGRGRGANAWWSAAGAMTFSVVLNADQHGPPPECRPLVALATGLAVRSLIQELLPDHQVQTKWPNDVLVADRKICGILTEQHATPTGNTLIIGIGVNVNNSMAAAPVEVQQRATSAYDLSGSSYDLTNTLNRLLHQLERSLINLQQDQTSVVAEFGRHHRLTGQLVTIETPTGPLTGRCTGMANDGALQLKVGDRKHEVRAGTVVEFT